MIEGRYVGEYTEDGIGGTGPISLVAGKIYQIKTDIALIPGSHGIVAGGPGVTSPGYVVAGLVAATSTIPLRVTFVATKDSAMAVGTIVCRYVGL